MSIEISQATLSAPAERYIRHSPKTSSPMPITSANAIYVSSLPKSETTPNLKTTKIQFGEKRHVDAAHFLNPKRWITGKLMWHFYTFRSAGEGDSAGIVLNVVG